MYFHPNEMYLYYDPSSSSGKQVRAYAHTVNDNINDFDLTRIHMTATLWEELLDMLHLEPKQLLDKSNPEYQEKIRGKSFDPVDWIHVLQRNPHLIKAPIAVYRDHAVLCQRPKDILKLDEERSIEA